VPPSNEQVENFDGRITDMLTVWRRLWTENDTMKAPPKPRPRPDRFPGLSIRWAEVDLWVDGTQRAGYTTFGVAPGLPGGRDFYEGGTLVIKEVGSYRIVANTARRITVQGRLSNSEVRRAQATWAVAKDDDRNWVPGYGVLLARLDLVREEVKEEFKPAYIKVMDARRWNKRRYVGFINNHLEPGYRGRRDPADDAKDLWSTRKFWTHLVVTAWQPIQSKDNDPDAEPGRLGLTLRRREYSAIYMETIRDVVRERWPNRSFVDKVCGTVAHEIGHGPIRDHINYRPPKKNLMKSFGAFCSDHDFFPKAQQLFRTTKRWWP